MRVFLALVFIIVFGFAGEISIATYNVENLFDCKNDGSEYKDFKVGSKSKWNCDTADEKLSRIKDVVLSLNSDIIALQEIENEQILKELVRGTEYKYAVFSGGENAPIGLGIISKIMPIKTQEYAVPNVKTRNILRVDFEFENKNFSVFVAHFPALKNGLSIQQKAERTLRVALEGVKNGVVLGDFNTPFGERSLLNDIILTRGYVDLWEVLEYKQRYSHVSANGKKSAIDHVLLSSDIVKGVELGYKNESFEIFRAKFMLDSKGYIKRENGRNLYSDHFPLKFILTTDTQTQRSGFFTQIFGSKDEIKAKQKDKKLSPAIGDESRVVSIDDIFAKPKNTPFLLSRAVVVHKDKNGFIISSNHRGIYVFNPDNNFELGQMMDMLITKTKIYKDALEVATYEVKKLYEVQNPEPFMMSESMLSEARSGDVIDRISGELKNGELKTPYGNVRVYSKNGRLKDGEITLKNVRVGSYQGKIQLVVER
ncbi:endonuclease [Campylobacter sp. faydin G-24]|uniref:Endonuclease n=1 Tax=Campylobacter anatolicus TaxID=2829105 RepID=A0ABS5HHT4_9BACT|nr:endonuclease/exonuclease/phosphatase family protein [Campylobacter anatolicus]MBR8463693.1 endonuclease [Campylobacter anatolicus]